MHIFEIVKKHLEYALNHPNIYLHIQWFLKQMFTFILYHKYL